MPQGLMTRLGKHELDVYVDTSVWNYIYADHLAENQKVTLDFLRRRFPFLAMEIVRQGLEATALAIFKSPGE